MQEFCTHDIPSFGQRQQQVMVGEKLFFLAAAAAIAENIR